MTEHQAALMAAAEAVLARVDQVAGTEHPATRDVSAPAAAGSSALAVTCACFGLTAFERDVLVLTAAAEIDASTARRCAAASGDAGRTYPTFSLALAALADPHWSALTPQAPLRRWRLVELDDETSLTSSRIRVDERILHFLAGVPYLDPRLRGVIQRAEPPDDLPVPHRELAGTLASRWTKVPAGPLTELTGADRQTRRDIAAWAADQAGLSTYVLQPADLPADPGDRDALGRLWEREAILLPAMLTMEADDTERRRGEAFCAALSVPVVLSADSPAAFGMIRTETVAVPQLGPAEQLRLWRSAFSSRDALGGQGARGQQGAPGGHGSHGENGAFGEQADDAGLSQLATQFSLPAHAIRAAAADVRREIAAHGGGRGDIARLAWQAGLAQARLPLTELGRRVEPRATRDDLVLPPQQRAILDQIVAHVRQRARVHEEWGFSAVLRRGLGVTALFAGGSGTGKTLAAEVVAGALGLDLFILDLSQIVSKYIGETEKNLRTVFDAAERGGAVLLFDEADALFGKRSEVKDSHDRYANIEVSYLLMRMEAYRGLAVLTTNMKKALDTAFMRRLRFVVEFPFPGPGERAEIWRRMIPERAPAEGLDFERLGQLTMTGGGIRNIALAAAFLAADAGEPLGMRHMKAAAAAEYAKMERTLTPAEVSGWD
jgi:hypothetical protein